MAIQSFADKSAEEYFTKGRVSKKARWASVKSIVKRKLDMLHYAAQLNDLQSPPGNRFEALKGDFKGCHSIRINDQWRIVFQWTNNGPQSVRIEDYH